MAKPRSFGSRFKHPGPHNPSLLGEQSNKNKAALVVITKAGYIRLLYQGGDGARWLECKDQSLLVATHSVAKQIRIYRVGVDWSLQCFVVDHLKTIVDCSPTSNILGESRLPSASPYPHPQLYHLEILSPTTDVRTKDTIPPLLIAFFCSTGNHNAQSSGVNEISTIMVRWELASIESILHPSFSQLASKKPNGPSMGDLQSDITFKRLQDVRVNKILVAVRDLNLATILALCPSDGSVEFRCRNTLDPLLRDNTLDRASGMAQMGLEFLPGDPCLHSALSPSACAVVTLDERNAATLRFMQIPQVYGDNRLDDAVYEAVAVASLMQFNMACGGYGNHHDDLSATMQLFQQQHLKDDPQEAHKFTHTFLSDMYRILLLNIDYSGDTKSEIYLKNWLHQKTLSMQLSLGYRGEREHRTLSSKVAFAILQLRWAALTFAMGLKLNPPETVRSFFGIFSWTLSLINFIMDELFTLSAEFDEHGPMNHELLEARIRAGNTPALALLFISQSRLLFKYNLRFVKGIHVEATQTRSHNPIWREIANMFSNSPVPPHQFEKVLAEVESSVRSLYASNQIPDSERRNIETNMLVSGTVPSKLWPAVESLLTKTLKGMEGDINRADLFFHDISWIGLSDDPASDQWRREHRLDIVRKIEVRKGLNVRQCTRCCAVMEDAAPPKGMVGWLVNMWRTCVCGNWWMDMGDKRGV
ncbi:MAG: hypothetical protein Q9182_003173 [Xanthomendoza sp. 2 TL-2023]